MKIKESKVAKKVSSGFSSAFNKTKENVQNPDLLKENIKKAYQNTKQSVNTGIQNIQDPEYRNEVKDSFVSGLESVKVKTGDVLEKVSQTFNDEPSSVNRNDFQKLDEIENDTPINILSDDEDSPDNEDFFEVQNQGFKYQNIKKNNDISNNEDDHNVQEENVPLIQRS